MEAPYNYSPRTLTAHEMYCLAAMYWPYEEVGNAVNVAKLESGWNTGAWNTRGEDSRGLWQVNVASGAHPDLNPANLWDPMVNAYWAYQIWRESGWRAWWNSANALHLL